MKSFQRVEKTNKNVETIAGVHTHTHTIMFTKLSTKIKKAVDYLTWKLALENIKKLKKKINKNKTILKSGITREFMSQVFSCFNIVFCV